MIRLESLQDEKEKVVKNRMKRSDFDEHLSKIDKEIAGELKKNK